MAKPSYRQNTKTFKFTNPHPKGLTSVSDCVFRAICIATGKDWLTVYDELCALGREVYAPPTDKAVYTLYLDKIAERISAINNGKRLLPTDLPKKGTFIIRQASHLVCVKDGKTLDTWNCGHKSAYVIWKIA